MVPTPENTLSPGSSTDACEAQAPLPSVSSAGATNRSGYHLDLDITRIWISLGSGYHSDLDITRIWISLRSGYHSDLDITRTFYFIYSEVHSDIQHTDSRALPRANRTRLP
eukprot:6515414-Pyramimonas_sp.AAC.2